MVRHELTGHGIDDQASGPQALQWACAMQLCKAFQRLPCSLRTYLMQQMLEQAEYRTQWTVIFVTHRMMLSCVEPQSAFLYSVEDQRLSGNQTAATVLGRPVESAEESGHSPLLPEAAMQQQMARHHSDVIASMCTWHERWRILQ